MSTVNRSVMGAVQSLCSYLQDREFLGEVLVAPDLPVSPSMPHTIIYVRDVTLESLGNAGTDLSCRYTCHVDIDLVYEVAGVPNSMLLDQFLEGAAELSLYAETLLNVPLDGRGKLYAGVTLGKSGGIQMSYVGEEGSGQVVCALKYGGACHFPWNEWKG